MSFLYQWLSTRSSVYVLVEGELKEVRFVKLKITMLGSACLNNWWKILIFCIVDLLCNYESLDFVASLREGEGELLFKIFHKGVDTF